ncbi:unnamed protein product [Fusarium graminearum]|nr:unnamed protein product [Fusarium graminearum]
MTDQLLLRLRARLCENRGMTVLVRANGPNHGTNHITILNRCLYRLQNYSNDSLTTCIPVGPFIKAVANAIRREKPLVSQNLKDARVKKKVCTGHDSL